MGVSVLLEDPGMLNSVLACSDSAAEERCVSAQGTKGA